MQTDSTSTNEFPSQIYFTIPIKLTLMENSKFG